MRRIHAIPTEYAGIQFRSRLEAKWAAFFDIAQWRWDYESIDLKGWIPDFVLYGDTQTILVEVKPFNRFDDWRQMIREIETATRGTEYKDHPVLLLGAQLPIPGQPLIGWAGERGNVDLIFSSAIMNNAGKRYGFFRASPNSRHDFITSTADIDMATAKRVEYVWRQATNKVQWQPKRRKVRG